MDYLGKQGFLTDILKLTFNISRVLFAFTLTERRIRRLIVGRLVKIGTPVISGFLIRNLNRDAARYLVQTFSLIIVRLAGCHPQSILLSASYCFANMFYFLLYSEFLE